MDFANTKTGKKISNKKSFFIVTSKKYISVCRHPQGAALGKTLAKNPLPSPFQGLYSGERQKCFSQRCALRVPAQAIYVLNNYILKLLQIVSISFLFSGVMFEYYVSI